MREVYRYEAKSVGGFVQQLGVCYVGRKYHHYVIGRIPEGKDPAATDKRLLEKYDIAATKHMRYHRKQLGRASLQYLRYDRTFIILATKGEHEFWKAEESAILDVKREPIKFRAIHEVTRNDVHYSIGFYRGHLSVRIEENTFKELKAYFEGIAVKRTLAQMFDEFRALSYDSWSGVREQLHEIRRAVNRRRSSAGYAPLETSAVLRKRKIYLPFDNRQPAESVESYSTFLGVDGVVNG